MRDITLEELLEAGCHFGHQVNRRNPKANDFIFEARSNVNIIDLGKTREGLLAAAEYVKELSARDGYLVIVGTKRQAKGLIEGEVQRAQDVSAQGLFYSTTRWVGGTLTNFSEVSKNFKRLEDLNKILAVNTGEYTKREMLLFERERNHLKSLYAGIATLDRIPDALLIIDTHLETTAVAEAHIVNIETVGIVDTNADPSAVDYAIPANDDAVGSIKLILAYLVDAWIEGKIKGQQEKAKAEAKESKETSTEVSEKTEPTATKEKEQMVTKPKKKIKKESVKK